MFDLNLKEGTYPIIILPNLGQPILINLKDFKEDDGSFSETILFEAIIIALPEQTIQEILQYFHENLYIQPVLKDEGTFIERRGQKFLLDVLEIKRVEKLDFRDQGVLDEENCIIWDIYNGLLQINNIFGKRNTLYKIKVQIKNTFEILRILKESNRSSLLCDIIHVLPNRIENKVNYHAIAFFNKDWSNFKFIQSSDFHIAQRNDFITKFLKDKAENEVIRYKDNPKKQAKINSFILTRDFEYREEFQEDKLEKLRYAKYNFNYNLRLLIDFINEQVSKNNLDFILMTGDLIDYLRIGRGNYQYKNNYQVFIEILLGLNRGLDKYPYFQDKEYINYKEILVPTFIIVGNHDYRYGHYSLRVGAIHSVFGLTKKDLKGYYDIKFFNYYSATRSKNKYLKDYFRYLNPNLNFRVKIGTEYSFIFTDTGEDSIADLHDYLKGGPSTKGLKDYQIDLLRVYIQLAHDEKIIIVMHTPPISPNFGWLTRKKFKRKFKLKRSVEWSDFFEKNLEQLLGNARLDKILNLKYQTIMYNWSTFLRICIGSDKIIRRKVDLILCGHTHTINEFRLREAQEPSITSMGFYFTKIPIMVPCEVYTAKYREVFKTFKNNIDLKYWFDVNKPFIFQTQAIGPLSLKYKFYPPGFRYFSVNNNQITQCKIFSLHLKQIGK